jgi:carbamoyltransferase
MYILGLNSYHADASAAILKDGQLLAATEEERFRRVKHWAGFPSEAIRFCLKEAGIGIKDIDYIAIGRDPSAKFWKKIGFVVQHPGVGLQALKNRIGNSRQILGIEAEFTRLFPDISAAEITKKLQFVEHHRAHLASAFFASPFEKAALLSIDGSGDFTTTMFGLGENNHINVLDSQDFPHSLGIFYSALTQFLGFPYYGDEYKVMGLAPYGNPAYLPALRKVVKLTNEGFRLELSYFRVTTANIIHYDDNHIPVVNRLFSNKLEQLLGPARKKGDELTQFHKDLAASVQKLTEEIIFHVLGILHEKTGVTDVCIAGGVAQNSVANGKITSETPFKRVYIPSAGHDAGISMGAAYYVYNHITGQERGPAQWSAYTGSQFTNEEVEAYLKEKNITYTRYDDEALYDVVSDCLINAGVVGWFQGRAEFGPRALGGRSILADPRRTDAKDLINAKIKRRESFRPFAPSILEEFAGDYFEKAEPVPFMEKVYTIKEDKRAAIPAVTHVDGSGRLQTVNAAVSPKYYKLIHRFMEKTGVPILLNTSFNENEPIVNAPEHALDCYLRTEMDMLVIENFVIRRDSR